MAKKSALTDDEILLSFIMRFEPQTGDILAIAGLYDCVIPDMKHKAGEMWRDIVNCGWSQDDFNQTLRETNLDEKLRRLVRCAFIACRNITDALLRGRQTEIMLEGLFKRSEKKDLNRAIDALCLDLLSETKDGRIVDEKLTGVCKSATSGRRALRVRAAQARARSKGCVKKDGQRIHTTGDAEKDVSRAVAKLFPDGIHHINALSVRLIKNELENVDGETITRILTRGADSSVSSETPIPDYFSFSGARR